MKTKADYFIESELRNPSLSYDDRQMLLMIKKEYQRFKRRLYPGPGF